MLSIKDIASMTGVSRGTVDRVLNGRSGVSSETSKKIMDIINLMDYSPNRLGKQLAIKKKKLKFGCILYGYADKNPYFADVVNAMKKNERVLEEYGIELEIRHTSIDDPRGIVRNMDELYELGVNGLIVSPVETDEVRDKIDALYDKNIPVVTIGTDFPESKRLAYVGSNSYQFGRFAGNLMGLFTNGRARVGILTGSEFSYNHQRKVQGFLNYVSVHYPHIEIIAKVINNDRDEESYALIVQLHKEYPQMDSVFFAAGGVRGGCQAVKDLGLAGILKIVSFDLMPFNQQMVKEGVILATIGQQPDYMAKKALDILLDYFVVGIKSQKDCFYSEPEIRINANFTL
jgi:LacI family transcriptional regulator